MLAKKTLRAAVVQHACGVDRLKNLALSCDYIQQAAAQGAELVLLQELHTGEYFCKNETHDLFDWAETIPGPSTAQIGALAKSLNIVIVASLFERRAAGIYHNTAVVLERDGTVAGIYRKMHIPDDPGYYEKFYFTPGDLGFEPVDTSVGKLGVLVCWDQWYPEAARLMALAGADLLLYPTAIGWLENEIQAENTKQCDAWVTIQRGHAIANGLPVMVANRVGYEANHKISGQGLHFWGSSFIVGPQGEFLAQASIAQAEILLADIDLAHSEKVRRYWPFLRDRRIDAYGDLIKRFRN